MNNLSIWCEGDLIPHLEDSIRNGDFTDMEHTEEMTALLEANGLSAECWVYGSYCRPLHSSWFRVEGATIIHTTHRQPYSYAIMPARMSTDEVNSNELDLVSRPAR